MSSWLSRRVCVATLGLLLLTPAAARSDDDPIPPPVDPGPGFEGILPAPELPPGYIRDQDTIPYGLQSVANTPVLHLGQSFTPARTAVDWVAFIFQNSTQPSDPMPPGPGMLQVSLYTGINPSDGALSGLLGRTDEVAIASNTTRWLAFHFPDRIEVTPGARYYLHVEQTDGYQSWVGIRHANTYNSGAAFGYLYDTVFNNPPQNLNWGGRDLHFAAGVIADGDYNGDDAVDGSDFLTWQRELGSTSGVADGDRSGGVGGADLAAWRQTFGRGGDVGLGTIAVPEGSAAALTLAALAGFAAPLRRRTALASAR